MKHKINNPNKLKLLAQLEELNTEFNSIELKPIHDINTNQEYQEQLQQSSYMDELIDKIQVKRNELKALK